jgi:nucleotide-binding universal stress UspA family protein
MTEHLALFHTLLAATAAGSAVDGAVLTAARLAGHHLARLCIVHAVPLPLSAGRGARSTPIRTPPSSLVDDDSGTAAQKLYARYAAHCPSLKPDDIRIVRGVAWEAVFRTALELNCDLIVMGPHTRPPYTPKMAKTNRFLGSTADGVINRSRCPVMIANGALETDLLDFKRIVVGVDFSSSCTAAMGLAALFARYCGAFISAFHMLPIAPYPKYTPGALHADRERQQKRMHALCVRLLKDAGHQSVLKSGVQPHVEILQFVGQVGADLIVMGSHTRDRTGKWYAGSVVQQVARHARCPVIIVNGPEALKPWGWVTPPI